jgi:hypothetical protein
MPRTSAVEGLKAARAMLVASDPGLSRLRMASRVTLTLLAVALALGGLHAALPLPVAAYGIAVITAMQGALVIRDAGSRQRAVTRAWCGLVGLAAVAMAILLQPWPLVSDGFFLVLVFAAVYARKFGPRWNAAGMFGFMCYFMGSYLHPSLSDLPGVAAAIVLSGAIAHGVRNVVLPERRQAEFHRTLTAVGQRVTELRARLRLGRAAGWPEAMRRDAHRRQDQITETILTAEGYLPLVSAGSAAPDTPAADLAMALYDLNLASETALLAELRAGGTSPEALDARDATLGRALASVRAKAAALPAGALDERPAAPVAPENAVPGPGLMKDPAFRLAIQVALAAGIAMTGGLMLSKTRWFWAILTAFLVFTNTQSRGDATMRALQRAFGTVAGIVVGIALATLLAGHAAVSIGLATVFVFAGFYLLQISYAAMTFFVTLVVSLLYGLLGEFTPELLVLRLEETLVGAAAGAFIAFVVLPRSTSAAVEGAVDAYLGTLDDLLAAVAEKAEGRPSADLIALSRGLDRRYGELATVARPLGSPWQLVRKPGRIRRTLLRFMAIAHWARILARALPAGSGTPSPGLATAIAALRAQIAEARAAKSSFFGTVPADTVRSQRPEPRPADFTARPDDPEFALDMLAHILDRAAHGGERFGQRRVAADGARAAG